MMSKLEKNSVVAKIATTTKDGKTSSLPSLLRGSVYGSCRFNLTRNSRMRKVFSFSEIDREMLRLDDA